MTTPPARESISLHEAADRLGVHYMTVYRYVRLGMLPARKVGGSWKVDPSDLATLRADQAHAGSGRQIGVGRRTAAPWSDRLRGRMLAGDAEGSWNVVEAAMAAGMEPADIYVEVLGPALREIGAMWRRGGLGIEREHMASGVAASIVGRLGPRFRRPGRHGGTVLVAMPAGERHGLGATMITDILRGGGHEVLNLGPDTPPSSLVAAMAETDGLLGVVVSVVDEARLPAARRLIAAARKQAPAVVVIAGGFAVPDEATAQSIGADGWIADARGLAGLIAELSAG
jgi:MerR family transcriptional regulator, light-induced transcriptional regulator